MDSVYIFYICIGHTNICDCRCFDKVYNQIANMQEGYVMALCIYMSFNFLSAIFIYI